MGAPCPFFFIVGSVSLGRRIKEKYRADKKSSYVVGSKGGTGPVQEPVPETIWRAGSTRNRKPEPRAVVSVGTAGPSALE